jgi:protein subunit release factor B
MSEIKELVLNGVVTMPEVGDINFPKKDVLADYVHKIFSIVPQDVIRPMKIVVDAGNGMAQTTFPYVLQKLPVQVEYLYLEPDGNFPNHEANPLKVETLAQLQKKVIETGADFGFALDGDADRIGLVDEKGQVVDASFVGALIGLEVLRNHPQARMLYDVRSSMIVPEVWQAAGASVEMCKVGHANIKKALKETSGAFASELSLHLYYQDTFDVESTDLSLLYMLQLLSREPQSLSELIAPLKKYFHSGEINFEVEDKVGAVSRVEEKYKNQASEISYLDGLWMRFEWGWLSVRLSNTEPVVRLNVEATTKAAMEEKVIDESLGAEAGYKSVMFEVKGRYAYGYLKSEHGTHRLVRISPFDAEKMRHTSFALIEVLPELDNEVSIELDPKDLRIDTFMSSGKGGQSVNTTYSAVRIVHIPTGITVSCQNERSQQQNKETALKVLKAKLQRLEEEKLAKEKQELRGEYKSAEWGNQIRSYVLHPYHLVKDHRTDYESTDPESVLEGEVLPLSESYLRWIKH